ncbi:MAG: hypothetical protein L0216_12175, partial [Planctomycetales bacterium]|nr:hypothetical protein [Planctomycetales bacterium]
MRGSRAALALAGFSLTAAFAAGQEDPGAAVRRAVLEAGRRHCVEVRIRLRPPGPFAEPRLAPYYLPPLAEDRVAAARREGRPLRLPGVDLGAEGILAPDPGIPPEAVAGVTVVRGDGSEVAAELAFLWGAPGLRLRVGPPPDRPPEPKSVPLRAGERLWTVATRPRGVGFDLVVSDGIVHVDRGGAPCADVPPGALVCDAAGRPLTAAVGSVLRPGDWRGGDERTPVARDLRACVETPSWIRSVALGHARFRLRAAAPGQPEEALATRIACLGGGRALAPEPLLEETVRRIAATSVAGAGGVRLPRGEVLGRLRGFAALVLSVEYPMGPAGIPLEPPIGRRRLPPPGELALALLPAPPGYTGAADPALEGATGCVHFRLVEGP